MTREETRLEILKILFQNERYQSFKEIETKCSASRGTVKGHLDDLKTEGLVEQSLSGRHPYRITKKGKRRFGNSLEKRWVTPLHDFLKIGIDKDPKVFFKNNCLAFIGDMPCYFDKSEDGMRQFLEGESRYKQNARKEGLTLEEYVRKRALRGVGFQRITVLLTAELEKSDE